MDPTSSLSETFSHLSVGENTPVNDELPDTSSTLAHVSRERDVCTDDVHAILDAKLLKMFSAFRKLNEEPDLSSLLCHTTVQDKRLVTLTTDEAEELLTREPSIKVAVRKAWNEGSFKDVRRLEILWPVEAEPSGSQGKQLLHRLSSRVSTGQSESATLQSWTIKYVGNASNSLYEHLASNPKDEDNYARYISIVQSSGMGKSRAVDELSKTHLVVPLNLRQESQGFPAADVTVRDWLLRSKTKLEGFSRAGAFLCALFVVVLDYLRNIDDRMVGLKLPANEDLPGSSEAKFRLLMTAGHTFSQQGEPRRKFYDEVLRVADEIWSPPEPSTPPRKLMPPSPGLSFRVIRDGNGRNVQYALKEETGKLMNFLIENFNVLQDYPPAIILSFDEAHSLTVAEIDSVDGLWSKFGELRRALRVIHSYPCFSVFLSTTGKVQQFSPDPLHDISSRLQLGKLRLIPPFCELGFDQLAEKAICGETTLERVASLPFMAKLGRPLFAARYIEGDEDIKKSIVMFAGEKLLCKPFATTVDFIRNLSDVEKLACMSVRLALEFNGRTLRAQDMEKKLVEKHMRVCLSVDAGFETAITIAPSEPLLAEASYLLMRNPVFDLPRSLLTELELPGLDKGDRGELIVMTICLQARDAAARRLQNRVIPVIEFICEMLAPKSHNDVLGAMPIRARTPEEATTTLGDAFRHSKIYFNHFIKLRDRKAINRKFLWGLIVRGAAGLCADYQYGVDVIVPFLHWDDTLRRENVSAFFLQSKNDGSLKTNPHLDLFDRMNPCSSHLGFFDSDGSNPVPIIRMVFALASPTPCVTVIKPPERVQPSRKGAFKAGFQADKYTSFDIWCGKASSETFRSIKNDDVYAKLLLRSRVFPDIYESKRSEAIQNATRNMNPATDVHYAHWEQFT